MIIQCNDADLADFYIMMSNGDIDVLERGTITISYILAAVCRFYGISEDDINIRSRKEEVIRPRQVVHYYSRLLTNKGFKTIGDEIGRVDHATVMHSCKTISNLIETDKDFRDRKIKPINHLLCIY